MICDEVRQVCAFKTTARKNKCKAYKSSSGWNYLDAFMYAFLIVSVILRLTLPAEQFDVTRIFYAVTLILFIFRIMSILYVWKIQESMVSMIFRVFYYLGPFCLIFLVFLFAYGTAVHSLLYPNSGISGESFLRVVYYPYYALFQQFEDLEALEFRCINSTVYTTPGEDKQGVGLRAFLQRCTQSSLVFS